VNVVDSSGWLEFFADGPNAEFFAAPLTDTDALLVPAISIYEVFKTILRQRDESAGLEAVAWMEQGRVVPLDTPISLMAARLSLEHTLPMADSIILATARVSEAILWTQDADFEGILDVRYQAKPPPPAPEP
jgi:predicted nucleic acid-binding protein